MRIITAMLVNMFFFFLLVVIACLVLAIASLLDIGIAAFLSHVTHISIDVTSIVVALMVVAVFMAFAALKESPTTTIVKELIAKRKGYLEIDRADEKSKPKRKRHR